MKKPQNEKVKCIKVKFVDFWDGYNQLDGNFFCDLLAETFDVEISNDPDILFFSCYGHEHLKYNCLKIFFSAENWKPNYFCCDYSITFQNDDLPKNLRLPLWVLYRYSYKRSLNINIPDFNTFTDFELSTYWKQKTKFCCFIVSNDKSKKRNDFFKKLTAIKHVDSAGKYLNNIGKNLEGGTLEKFKFIADYKFVISFENESSNGYITEKVFEPLLVGAIPLYWGSNDLGRDFNTNRILYLNKCNNEEEFIKKILEIDANDALAFNILRQGCFTDENYSLEDYCKRTKLFLNTIIEKGLKRTVSKNIFKSNINNCFLAFNDLQQKFKHRFNIK